MAFEPEDRDASPFRGEAPVYCNPLVYVAPLLEIE
jgi:hypothetical protein